MDSGNRILILVLLLALLYALYMYQQYIESNEKLSKSKKKIKAIKYNKGIIPPNDDIRLDNVSQIDLGSLEDVRSYQDDSLLGSYGSDDISAMLADDNY